MHGVAHLSRSGYRYKKAGVELLEISAATTVPGDLWSAPDTPRRKALMKAVDTLKADLDRATVRFAASGIAQGWKLRSEQRSARYATEWAEILVA